MRLACLHVPDFPLAALLRAQPELRGESLAVTDGPGPRAKLLAISPAAARHGLTAGLTAAQAAAIDTELVMRPVSPDMLRAAQAALCDAAESFSPRVEDTGAGIAYLDVDGLSTLYASESQLANALAHRARHLGLEASVGIAGSKAAASLAARNGGGVSVIPPGEEWSFLAAVPIEWLDPGPELRAILPRWGIHTIGDLTTLSVSAVGARLGPDGVQLARRARGEDTQPLVPRPLPVHFEEGVELAYGLDGMEPFLFVLRGVLDRLTTRLAVRGFVCGDLRLSLRLETHGRDERAITVAAPSNDVKSLLALTRLQLEAHPPAAAIAALRVLASPARLRAAQLDLFRPHGPAPARLAVTLARLTAICGADRVGTPTVADTHRPETFEIAPFEAVRMCGGSAVRDAPPGSLSPSVPASVLPLALRAFRPPQAVEVFCERDRPDFVRGATFAGRVVHAAGPWRMHGEWWSDQRYARDYFEAQLSDGGVYRLYCEHATRSWFVDGVYD
jgi:protein ImuB